MGNFPEDRIAEVSPRDEVAGSMLSDVVLKKERDFMAAVLDTVDSLVVVLDRHGRIVWFNRACERATGYLSHEVKGRHVWDFLLIPEEIEPIKRAFQDLGAGLFPRRFENHWVTKSGRRMLLSWSNTVLLDKEGAVEYIVPTGIDITEQRRLHDLIVQAKEDWESSFETINDAITIHDDNFNVVRANKAAQELLGLPLFKLTGQKCYESYHGTGCPPDGCPSCDTLKTAKPSLAEIYEPHLKKHLEIKAYPRFNKQGGLIGLIHIVRDVTERKQLEEQLRHSQKMDAIGTLAGGIAHDFNNILSVIIGFGEIMQMNMKKDDPQNTYLDEILAAADRATRLTQSLLAFGRKQVLEPKQVNLNNIVKNLQKMLERIIGEDIELKTDLTDADLAVMADYSQVEQVLMNLTINARAAMPDGGALLIETAMREFDEDFVNSHGYGQPGRYAVLSMTDTGIGMDEQTRKKIFEPFFTTKELGRGTGLGLSIVYGIINQHRGYVNVYSEPGQGTTFRIYLPIVKTERSEVETIVPPPVRGGTETVLIAEDYASVRKMTSDMLRKFGYSVVEAEDGEDAVRQFMKYQDEISLLILDVIMPKKNGKVAYEEILAMKPGMKALFLSGYTADLIHRQGILDSGLNFVPKPVSINDLLRKMRDILDS